MWPFQRGSKLDSASFILRRIAWLKQTTMTKVLKEETQALAARSRGEDLCQICREHDGDKQGSLCTGSVFNPNEQEKAA